MTTHAVVPRSFMLSTVEVHLRRCIGTTTDPTEEDADTLPLQEPTVTVLMSVYGLTEADLLLAAHTGARAALEAVEQAQGDYEARVVASLQDLPGFASPEAAGADRERLSRARTALIETGYFEPDEVGDDIAPRIIELAGMVNPG